MEYTRSLKNFHNVNTYEDYGARYTTMREKVFNNLGIILDKNYRPKRITISRFTSPQLHN